MYKLIVAGSRNYNDYSEFKKLIDDNMRRILKVNNASDIEFVSGGCRGVDKMGEKYAEENGMNVKVFEADWEKYGKSAGPIRNSEMADYGDALIAFFNGESKGTLDMINKAKKKKMPITIINIPS
jgi:hypothetical protein